MKSLIFIISLFSTQLALANNLECDNVIDFSQHKGKTYLSFMKETVKPLMDQYATAGYELAGKEDILHALNNVSSKVRRSAFWAAKGKDNLMNIAEQLDGKVTNLYELPDLIASIDSSVNRWKLSTFFGLASCGGAIIKFSEDNYAYNIHYGTGENDKDNRTGRSFGEGLSRDADDASDKNYLIDLEEFVTEHKDSIENFYKTLVKSLANSDSSDFNKISKFGQTLLTDFLAVYTAEQARNLMDGRIHAHWDAALLEVTLMGAFHAGQDKLMIFYKDPYTLESNFTDTVYNQDNGCSEEEREVRGVRLYDYWQFSASIDPEHCKRSGINITKKEFRTLGKMITKYERKFNPELVAKVERHFTGRKSNNIFYALSKFFINDKTPETLEAPNANQLAEDFTAFLLQVKKDANEISKMIHEGTL